MFLPTNTTSITKPMDAGIIKKLKLHYCQILAAHCQISASIWERLADILGADNISPFAEYVKNDNNEVGTINI